MISTWYIERRERRSAKEKKNQLENDDDDDEDEINRLKINENDKLKPHSK